MNLSGLQEITFGGHSLSEFGCVILEPPTRPFPKRRYEKQSIYGRSGDLVIDGEAYDNIPVTYKIATIPGLYGDSFIDELLSKLKVWLCSSVDYQKLYDTELPEGFYYAFCSGISDAVCTFDDMYEFSITFDCKPFFYYDRGQISTTYTQNPVILYNPGNVKSDPLMRVHGSGSVTCLMGDYQFTLSSVSSGGIYIDSEKQLVYDSSSDRSDDFEGDFPKLVTGKNTIRFTGDYIRTAIIPRWCRL